MLNWNSKSLVCLPLNLCTIGLTLPSNSSSRFSNEPLYKNPTTEFGLSSPYFLSGSETTVLEVTKLFKSRDNPYHLIKIQEFTDSSSLTFIKRTCGKIPTFYSRAQNNQVQALGFTKSNNI